MNIAKECEKSIVNNEPPGGCRLLGVLAHYGELFRLCCCRLIIAIQPFAYVVADYICYDGDKQCEKMLHSLTSFPPERVNGNISISYQLSFFYHFFKRQIPEVATSQLLKLSLILDLPLNHPGQRHQKRRHVNANIQQIFQDRNNFIADEPNSYNRCHDKRQLNA